MPAPDDVTPLERPGLVVDWAAFDRLGSNLQAVALCVQAAARELAAAGKALDAALTTYRAIAQRARTTDGRAARVAPGPGSRA